MKDERMTATIKTRRSVPRAEARKQPHAEMENMIALASSFVFSKSKSPPYIASNRNRLFHLARYLLTLSFYYFFFFLRVLLSLLSPPSSPRPSFSVGQLKNTQYQHTQIADSAIACALSQMLAVMNSIHVGSRKYEFVRALADRVMDENVREGSCDINRAVLSSAFSRTMGLLEEAMSARSHVLVKLVDGQVSRAVGAVRNLLEMARSGTGVGAREGSGALGSCSAEKLAAELLWLAQKMAECGATEEAVSRWGSASGLGAMAVGAEPPLQAALVKVSAFLFKQAKDMEELGMSVKEEEYRSGVGMKGTGRGEKMNMMTSWLPLLCHARNGTDSPVLSSMDKAEMEAVLEQMIEGLSNFQQQQVLSLWLHHFTACSYSDWPNLQACYARWYTASRRAYIASGDE